MIKYLSQLVVGSLAELKTRGQENDGQVAYLQGELVADDGLQGDYRWDADSTETADDDKYVAATGVTRGRWVRIGKPARKPTVNTPTSGTITMEHFPSKNGVHTTRFTLTAARMTITDATTSGSHGSLKLCDLAELAYTTLGCRQNYTAFAEGATLTGGAGDAVFDIGVGSVAIAAPADGALTGTNDDIGDEIAVTLSSGTGTGTNIFGDGVAHNGTATAGSFNLNVSGTAATIDATSTLDVTGTIEITWADLGDD